MRKNLAILLNVHLGDDVLATFIWVCKATMLMDSSFLLLSFYLTHESLRFFNLTKPCENSALLYAGRFSWDFAVRLRRFLRRSRERLSLYLTPVSYSFWLRKRPASLYAVSTRTIERPDELLWKINFIFELF